MNICPTCGGRIPSSERLSRSERNIVTLLVDEKLSNEEIAARCGMEPASVSAIVTRIFLLLDVASRDQLEAWWHTELFQLGLAA